MSSFGAEFWNERYSGEDFVYGTEPNEFFKESLDKYLEEKKTQSPSNTNERLKILLPADGEGRNGVSAATLGFDVTSIDQSSTAKEKALQLASQKEVEIDYKVGDLNEIELPENYFDAAGLFFFHLPEEQRELIHKKVVNSLKPGGILIFEAYEKDQLGKDSGGPQDLDVLYSLEDIITDFIDLDIKLFSKEITHLNEGPHHNGEAAVIRLIGTKQETVETIS
ncbi:MAG: class I SAM-dependent methyltransferase [Melioribacteraceae bacterium]|nr:class I SAM-dependent methyltransferase [Melioribacteraceae bacterium]